MGRIEGSKHIDGAEQLSAHAGQGQFRGYRPARDVSATVIADICKMVGTTQDNLLLVMKKSK